MPMFFLDKRAQVICNELKKESVHQKVALSSWEMKKGNFVTPADALADPSPFTPFDRRTMHWYGPDEHYWFRADMTVPESFDGKTLVFHLRTQIEEWDDAKNPQFLLFVDGEVSQGMDMNHREVLITRSAKAGQTYHIELQSYTGTLHAEFSLIAEMWEVDPEINSLYWDLQVPLRAFSRLDEESRSRMDLTRVINDTVNLLDLREPYSEAYYASIREASAYIRKHLYEELGGHDEVIASCIGHTRAQFLHFISQDASICTLVYTLGRGLFFGDTHDDIVPIGQNEHHVRGAYTNDRITPTTVVITIILQNTRPIAFQSPQAKYICTPNTTKIKNTINKRKPKVRTNFGIGL